MKKIIALIAFIMISGVSFGQTNSFEKVNFILGEWNGTGSGFGNDKLKIESSFQLIMNGKYIEVKNESRFEPTEKNPEGEHHIDKGFISFDNSRKLIIFRQFNNEGYINQYILNDSISNDSILVFETEIIENFVPGGKARWTIKKNSESEIETIFDVSFPNKEYSCFGINKLIKK
ncbi:hypothetical protein [Lutibacter sp.]|uniref:hypothetical protein n=1 Tax=Lutibacter sp. TaxID=1925666 RepID=UPI0034A02F57